jgi:hypothetical protein
MIPVPMVSASKVFGVGATGWGTLQRYLYYIHEGYRFSPMW